MTVRPDFYRRYRGISNIEFSPFDLHQSFRYNGKLARERREVVAALVGALLVDTHTELKSAWQALERRGASPTELAVLGRVPLTEAEALELARNAWQNPAVRNQKKIAWQSWAQQKYRALQNPKSKGHFSVARSPSCAGSSFSGRLGAC